MGKRSLLILGVILIVFLAIVWASGLVGNILGPVGENIALGLVAALLLIGFIKSKKEEKEERENTKKSEGEEN